MANESKADKKVPVVNCQVDIEGVQYQGFGLTADMTGQLQLIRDLELKEDDIICVGFPRSGNHWLFVLVNMITRQTTEFCDQLFSDVQLELMGRKIEEKIQNMASPRIFTSHIRAHRFPKQVTEKRVKIVYPIRSPKDAMVSLYRLLSNRPPNTQNFDGTWDEFFQLHMSGQSVRGLWTDHVLIMERFMKEHPDCPVYVFSYERMKEDPLTVVKELCSFLEQPEDLAADIVAATEFSHMKKALKEGKIAGEEILSKKGSDVVFRKGETGGWKEYFTVAQNECFDKEFTKKMAGCHLADLVRKYL